MRHLAYVPFLFYSVSVAFQHGALGLRTNPFLQDSGPIYRYRSATRYSQAWKDLFQEAVGGIKGDAEPDLDFMVEAIGRLFRPRGQSLT
jgi:hypothetical protein